MGALADELEELLGADAMRCLREWAGGRMLYVPRSPAGDHEICQRLGCEAAEALAWRYGGDRIYVAGQPRKAERDARALELLRAGWTQSRVAARLGLSERQVRNIKRSAE